MKKLLAAVLVLWLFCASALGDSLVTNGGVSLDESALPYNTEDPSAPVVYFISEISPEALVKAYRALGTELPARAAMSTAERPTMRGLTVSAPGRRMMASSFSL